MQKQLRLIQLAIATAFLFVAPIAQSAVYPPGPSGTCLDSVTIEQVQNPAALCHPISGGIGVGDTVFSVAGIVTGFDPIPTGFGFYIQNSQGGPWTGIDVFTHGSGLAQFMGLQLGDSVVVEWARVEEFQGGTELLGPNGSFSAPNIILRKASSGNPLPPFHVGTTTELQTLPTNPNAEQWEGCLVQINESGPGNLVVARTSLTGGLPFSSFLLVDSSAPSDSVLVDAATLFLYTPPPVGVVVSMVRGIYEQRTSGYRIQIRNGNDIIVATPPGVVDAYPVTDTRIRVVFDRDVTAATATDLNNYSLASFGSVDAATMDGASAVLLDITNGLGHGPRETVSINGVTSLANGLTMSSPSSRVFVNGVLSCLEMAGPSPDSLVSPGGCVDMSPYAVVRGQLTNGVPAGGFLRSTLTGVVTGQYGNLFYTEDEGSPIRGAVTVFAPPAILVPGHKYVLAGGGQEFFGETEFASVQYVQDLGSVGVPASLTVPVADVAREVCDVNQNITTGEDYESMLVTLDHVKVVKRRPTAPTFGFFVAGPSPTFPDTILVENQNAVLGPNSLSNPNYPPLNSYVTVTGVVHYNVSTHASAPTNYRVCPRSGSDIVIHGLLGVGPSQKTLAFAVYPNPARRANIAFTLPTESEVELGVFDVSGRQVAQIVKGRLPAGDYSRVWNGRDAGGQAVSAGVYFYRLKAGGEVRNVRTIMLGGN